MMSRLLCLVATVAIAGSAFAQKGTPPKAPTVKPPVTAPAKKPAKVNPSYVCSICKTGFSHNAAKALKMKCPMGHPLTKMDALPAGYKAQDLGDLKKSGAIKTAPKPPTKTAPKK